LLSSKYLQYNRIDAIGLTAFIKIVTLATCHI